MEQRIENDRVAELVHRIRQGDPTAESQLVERFSRGLSFMLRRLTWSTELAEDLHQEAFRIVLERLRGQGIDQPAKLGEFLSATARNLFRGELRNRRRHPTEGLDHVEERAYSEADPLLAALRNERMELIRHLIGELRHERDRQLLYRFYIAEQDKEDICIELGLSGPHFNRVLFRARQRFKNLLARFEKRQRARQSTVSALRVLGLLALGLLAARSLTGRESADPISTLRPDVPIERDLAGGETHVYQAELTTESSWLVTAEQAGADVEITAWAPDGRRLGPVNAPTYRRLTETLVLPAGFLVDGEVGYRLEVHSPNPAVGPGRYTLRIRELPEVTAEDRQRLTAEVAMSAAAELNFRAAHPAEANDGQTPSDLRREAAASYQQALTHWRALGQRREQARCLFALAVLASEAGNPTKAVEHYSAALAHWRELGDAMAEAETMTDLGLAYWKLGDNDQAGEWLRQALFLQKRLGHRYGEAVAQNNLCLRAHSQGKLPKALECYLSALQLYRGLGELGEESILLSNLGSLYRSLGEPELSREHHLQALALRRATDDRARQARTLNNLAVLAVEMDETQQALQHYQQALEIFRETGDRRWEARTLSNLGAAYLNLGELQRAVVFLDEALPIRRQTGDRRGEIVTLNHRGYARGRLGDFAAARADHQRALDLARQLDYRQGEARALEALGRVLIEVEDFSTAHTVFQQALALASEMGDRLREAEVLQWKGEAETSLGKPEQALSSLGQALELHRIAGDRPGESGTLRALARADRKLGQTHSARRRLDNALELLESMRTRVLSPKLRATILATHHETYELLIDTLMELHASEPEQGHNHAALEVSERSRARTLLEILDHTGVGALDVDPDLLARRRSLERRLSAKTSRQLDLFRREHTPQEWQALETKRHELAVELENLEAKIHRASPRRVTLNQAQILPPGQIRELLEPNTVLLEYHLGGQRSFLWWIDDDSISSFELPGRDEIETAARRCHQALSTFDLRAGKSDAEAAAALSRLILGPVADRLVDQRLVIVADGALHYVPFAALPSPETAGAESRLLLERHEVVYLPSASALAAQRRTANARSAPKWAAALGDPVFSRNDPRTSTAMGPKGDSVTLAREGPSDPQTLRPQPLLERSLRDLRFGDLERLPSTRREVAAIAELAPPGEVLPLLGFDASRTRLFSHELRDYRIVHFATHGLVNARDPELSGLVLSLFDRAGRSQDGFLRLPDIYNLKLGAELVVLSGCQTALGQEVRGEGLWGLTRGFLHAGVPRVAASLWRVEDQATTELMTRFYRGLRVSGLRPASALRQAQLELHDQRQWRDPYFWAAFLLQGDWR